MLWISWRKRVFSSFDFIFCETDTLSANGISTRNLPAKDNSAVRRGPLVEMGSLVMLLFYVWLKIDKGKYGLKPVYDGKLLVDVLSLSVWSMLHAFISEAPWFLFFVVVVDLGKTAIVPSLSSSFCNLNLGRESTCLRSDSDCLVNLALDVKNGPKS